MSIDTHCEGSAVAVSKPSAYSWDVDTGLNASCGEKVPEIVVREDGIFQAAAGSAQGSMRAICRTDAVG